MPELPEVETLCRQLNQKICGCKILAGKVYDQKLSSIKNLKTGKVVRIERQGKMIVVHLDSGLSIRIHLRMTGRIFWQKSVKKPSHGRWRLSFADGNIFLVDPRRFATVNLEKTRTEKITNDLMVNFDEKAFLENHATRKISVKTLLMDPRAFAGIGNIYACEILHRSGIDPRRQASTLSKEKWKKVFAAAKSILKKGIEKRGSSVSDWRDLYGRHGENQFFLKAYGRAGKKCLTCGGKISRIKQGGRSTFYCPDCQI